MKRAILIVVGLMFSLSAMAQKSDREVRRFEIEPNIGIATESFITASIEARYNFNHRPWDVGINTSFDFNGSRITAVGDYNFARKKNSAFFIGVGAGWANTSILNIDEAIEQYGDSCCAPTQDCLCLYPRVGVELFRHFRLAATVNTYNFKEAEFLLTFGVAIGGGNKK